MWDRENLVSQRVKRGIPNTRFIACQVSASADFHWRRPDGTLTNINTYNQRARVCKNFDLDADDADASLFPPLGVAVVVVVSVRQHNKSEMCRKSRPRRMGKV